jgi:pyruvate/2-oxoglutarate dehydrogenase complex dihydrolipoamide acyltransferase (E2) component
MSAAAKPAGHVVDLSPGRRAWLNALDLPGPSHWMCGLLEVDVTVARQRIAEEKARTGEGLSFTGFLISCLARAVDENKEVQAYRKGRRQIVVFDDVNVGMLIEHRGGLMAHVIERANQKTCREIHREIRVVQSEPVPPKRGMPSWFRAVLLLPWPLSALVKAAIGALARRDPARLVAMSGTTFISAVGMFAKGHGGWGISATPHSLSLFAGGITTKPAVVDGRIVPREILDLTVLLDHAIVDGAPATRFVRRLVELIESGYGLERAAPVSQRAAR